MSEKVYKTMSITGAAGITVGVVILVTGTAVGVISVISGIKLLKDRQGLTF